MMFRRKIPAFALLALLAVPFSTPAHGQSAPMINVKFASMTGTPAQAGTVAAEATDITFAADVSGSLNSKWFKFYDALNAHCYYLWLNINSAGVDPAVASCTGIVVAGATNDTAATLAGTARTNVGASGAATYITVSGATTHLILTNKTNGATTDVTDGTAPTGFTISKSTDGVSGTAAIAGGSVLANVGGWEICNAGVNTSTWLAVGQASDPTSDGVRLSKGSCFTCLSCPQSVLKLMKVAAQAGSNDYTVVQFKQ